MNGDRFESRLSAWLQAEAPARVPAELLGETLAVTSRTRQWTPGSIPAWLGRLRAASPVQSGLIRPALLAALLVGALLGALILAGAMRPVTPRNGLLTYAADNGIWTTGLAGGDPRRLDAGQGVAWSPVWSPSGDRLAYLTLLEDAVRIVIADADGRPLATFGSPDDGTIVPEATIEGWSPDGRAVVVPVADADGVVSVALLDVESGAFQRLDHEAAYWYSFGFSPDGEWLGIKSGYAISFADIVVARPNGTDIRTLVTRGRTLDVPSFTQDGSEVVFHQQSGPTTYDGDIAAVDIESGGVRTLVDGPANDLEPRLSPDGTWLAFNRSPTANITAALDRLGDGVTGADLYVTELDAGQPRLVATDVWPGATWSPDSTTLVALTPDLRQLVVVPAVGSRPVERVDLPHEVGSIAWQPRGP